MTKIEFHLTISYAYNIKDTSNENKGKDYLGDYWLIQYQILQTNIIRIVWQTEERITDEILGVKELTPYKPLSGLCYSGPHILEGKLMPKH